MSKQQPNTSRFAPKLTSMFEQIEPEFRKHIVAQYRKAAEGQLEGWLKWLEGPKPITHGDWHDLPRYVKVQSGSSSYHQWEDCQDKKRKGEYRVNYEFAEKEADASVDYAKVHFINKQSKKLDTATSNHKPNGAKIGGHLQISAGLVTGFIVVEYSGGDSFTLTMSIITNCRYGGRYGYTSFHQFPARFNSVKLKGKLVKARFSESWMETNFK